VGDLRPTSGPEAGAPRLRPARPDEAERVARFHWETRLAALSAVWPVEVITHRPFEERLAGWRALVGAPDFGAARTVEILEDDAGAIAGVVSAGPGREDLGPWTGQVYQLYLREDLRGRGLGRRLLRVGFDFLARAGHGRGYLWTPGANPASRGFYEHCGGELFREEPLPRHPAFTRVAYGWTL